VNVQPPVGRFSPRDEIEAWIEELERLLADPELQGGDHQRQLRAHLNDALTWRAWDLHRKVEIEGREVMEALREVGALGRRPGDPPPPEDAG